MTVDGTGPDTKYLDRTGSLRIRKSERSNCLSHKVNPESAGVRKVVPVARLFV